MGRVPAFTDGTVNLNNSNSIAHYVGNDATRGGANEAMVLNWISFADDVLEPAACTWVYPTLGMYQYNKQNTEKAREDVKKALTVMNDHLKTKTFLVGERISQADISVACTLVMLYQHVMDASFRGAFANVNRWFNTCVNQAQFKKVLGDVKMCTKMAQFDAKKYNEIFGKGKKDAAPKKQEKKAQAKGAGDSKPKIVTAAEAAAAAPAPKKVDPWADAPEATMDMDAWKRCSSTSTSTSPRRTTLSGSESTCTMMSSPSTSLPTTLSRVCSSAWRSSASTPSAASASSRPQTASSRLRGSGAGVDRPWSLSALRTGRSTTRPTSGRSLTMMLPQPSRLLMLSGLATANGKERRLRSTTSTNKLSALLTMTSVSHAVYTNDYMVQV